MSTDCKVYRNTGGIGSLTDLNHPDQVWEEVKVKDYRRDRVITCPACKESLNLDDVFNDSPNPQPFTQGRIQHRCGSQLYVNPDLSVYVWQDDASEASQ